MLGVFLGLLLTDFDSYEAPGVSRGISIFKKWVDPIYGTLAYSLNHMWVWEVGHVGYTHNTTLTMLFLNGASPIHVCC